MRASFGDGGLAVRDARHFLQSHTLLDRPFYAGPGYTHVLALTMALFGTNALVLRIPQIACDALTAVLLARLGTRLGGRAAGPVRGLTPLLGGS